MEIKNLKRDTASVEGGKWVGNLPEMGEMRVLVRGFGSTAYNRALDRRRKSLPADQLEDDGTTPTAEAYDRIIGEAMHEAILLDWDGLTSDGKPFAYDSDTAKAWLTDPDYKPFRNAISQAANSVDRSRASTVETAKKK